MSKSEKELISSLHDSLVCVNRVAKVVKGGRKFSFAVIVVVGNAAGMVGYGYGKADEVSSAHVKAKNKAINNMIYVPLYESRTIQHDVEGVSDASKILLRRAVSGTGVIAGGPLRNIFECLGIKDVVAKSCGSSNTKSMIDATFDALCKLNTPYGVAMRRSKDIDVII